MSSVFSSVDEAEGFPSEIQFQHGNHIFTIWLWDRSPGNFQLKSYYRMSSPGISKIMHCQILFNIFIVCFWSSYDCVVESRMLSPDRISLGSRTARSKSPDPSTTKRPSTLSLDSNQPGRVIITECDTGTCITCIVKAVSSDCWIALSAKSLWKNLWAVYCHRQNYSSLTTIWHLAPLEWEERQLIQCYYL